MGGVAGDGEGAAAFKLGVPVDHEAALLTAVGGIAQSVVGALGQCDGDAFPIFDVDGGARRAVQRQSVEDEGGLVFAIHQRRIRRCSPP